MQKMIEGLTHITELISTGNGTQGSLLIPKKIFATLIGAVDKKLIPRSEAAIYIGPAGIPGSSIDIDLDTPNTLKVKEVAEGAEVWLGQMDQETFNMKPVKYGITIKITREMMEDSMFDLLRNNITTVGKAFAENENSLIISDALDNASATTSQSGESVTIANITTAMNGIEEDDYEATTYVIGNEVLYDLRNIDTFVEADKMGNREILATGYVGKLFGMNVIVVSSNAGMTTTSSYVFDNKHAYIITEKRTITMENVTLPTFDMEGAVLTQRIKVRQLRAEAIQKITSI